MLEEGTNFITLHSKFLHITAAAVTFQVDGVAKKIEMVSMKFDVKRHVGTFEFEEALPLGDAVFSCSFEGELNNQMAGFYRSTYTDLDGKKKVVMGENVFTVFPYCSHYGWDLGFRI